MRTKLRHVLLSLVLLCMTGCGCEAQTESIATDEEAYTYGRASRDGIGKFYQGREIAHVMGHLGARWLERPERNEEENTLQLLKNLELTGNETVADIGAGTGYYTFRLAKHLPDGKVLAVDIQKEMIAIMREKQEAEKVRNVTLIQGSESNPNLPENAVDLVLFVDVYHELSHPKEMMQAIVRALKPNGRIYLVEYRMEDPSVPIKRLHKMSLQQAVKEMNAVGLSLKKTFDNLPWQHCMVFGK